MELQEALDKIKALEAELETTKEQLTTSQSQFQQLSNSSSESLNSALREAHATKQILEKHNIGVDLSKLDLSKITITDGKTDGDVGYEPPQAVIPQDNHRNNGTKGLTSEDINKMTPEQITDNMSAIKEFAATNKGSKDKLVAV